MAAPKAEPVYLTTAELAALLRKTPNAIRVMRCRGLAPKSFRLGKDRLTSLAEVEAWERGRTA